MNLDQVRADLLGCFMAALDAVDPEQAVASALEPMPGRVVVLALGKAAPAMCRGAARGLGVDRLSGLAVSNHAAAVPDGIKLLIGGHPVPNESSIDAGTALLQAAGELAEHDVAVVLVSGGGSALAEVLVDGVSLADVVTVNELLLKSGADIFQTNTVRRRLSKLKGGGLADEIAPARLITLVVSDVIGDIPDTIASGPTVASTDGPGAALGVVRDLGIYDQLPSSVVAALASDQGLTTRSPAQEYKIIVSGAAAAHAAAKEAERLGYAATVVDTRLDGDAAAAAGEALQRSVAGVSVFAGETTVVVSGDGEGGRNQEAALVAATIIEGQPGVVFLAAGTDGIDGTTEAAGAFADATTVGRAAAAGLDPNLALDRNDSGTVFAVLGDQVVTGPTGTNVGDLWLVHRHR